MATLVPFAIKKDDGTVITTLAPSNNANGIAEFKNADSARSQAYLATGRVSGAAQTRRFTFKLSVPKVSSQIVNGVELPVTAWRAYVDVSVQVPIFPLVMIVSWSLRLFNQLLRKEPHLIRLSVPVWVSTKTRFLKRS